MDCPFVSNAHAVFETRAVQSLVQSAFDSPIVPVQIEKLLNAQLIGSSTGDQVFDLGIGLLAQSAVQAADLRRPGQAQLGGLNGSCP